MLRTQGNMPSHREDVSVGAVNVGRYNYLKLREVWFALLDWMYVRRMQTAQVASRPNTSQPGGDCARERNGDRKLAASGKNPRTEHDSSRDGGGLVGYVVRGLRRRADVCSGGRGSIPASTHGEANGKHDK